MYIYWLFYAHFMLTVYFVILFVFGASNINIFKLLQKHSQSVKLVLTQDPPYFNSSCRGVLDKSLALYPGVPSSIPYSTSLSDET